MSPAAAESGLAEQGITAGFPVPNLESTPVWTPADAYSTDATSLETPQGGTALPAGSDSGLSCADNLTFMGDLTYPDRTKVAPGQSIEKRWKVRNSGTCDWGPAYRFRWAGGTELSPRQEIALYPAVAGSEAAVAVLLTAPAEPGRYVSNWRAHSPAGIPFGDVLYIDIVVSL